MFDNAAARHGAFQRRRSSPRGLPRNGFAGVRAWGV